MIATASAGRACPVCGFTEGNARQFLQQNIDTHRISEFTYASRKEPEFMCHRLVCCNICDVVYAPEPPSQSQLAAAYQSADYDSAREANDAAAAYESALANLVSALPSRLSALEIGAGSGAFLRRLQRLGFEQIWGIEPSVAAIEAADASVRPLLINATFDEAMFTESSFDLVCCFMTMEHVPDPTSIAAAAYRLLRPGGAFVTVTHDYRALVNRVLGSRSPIIDIEHVQLFSRNSIRRLFGATGFTDVQVRTFTNRYAARYWLRLLPLPGRIKNVILQRKRLQQLLDVRIGLNVGNIVTTGRKPPL